MEADDLKNDVSVEKKPQKSKSRKKTPKTTNNPKIDDELSPSQPAKPVAVTKKKKSTSKKKKTPAAVAESISSPVEKNIDTNSDAQPMGPVEVSKVVIKSLSNEKTARPRPEELEAIPVSSTEETTADIAQSNPSDAVDEPAVKNVQVQGSTVTVQPLAGDSVSTNPESAISDPLPVQPVQVAQQVQIDQTINLPLSAIKIRNVVGKICDVRSEVIANRVIVQGIAHEQLYYVATDGIVHHLASDDHFSAFVDVPGAEAGMNAQVSTTIEDIITELAPDGLAVTKKVVIQVFVKVTETVQVNLQAGDGPLLFVQQVVGENTEQTLVEADITLSVPAIKVDEIVGKICNLETEIIKDKVIIQGILHKQIFFVDSANLGRHQGEDLPFSLFVDAPGAAPGMDVQVHPVIEGIFFELITPTILRQKAVLEFFVKITEDITIPVALGSGPLFKVEGFIGENNVQDLSDTTITLFTPAVKVREIVSQLKELETHVIKDKVIVQGLIHKQIFFIGTDNVEYHQAENVPFSVFLDILGASAGDLVHLTTKIEAVFFELLNPMDLRQKIIIAINAVLTREIQLNLAIGTGPLFKLEQVIGENTTQVLVVTHEAITPINFSPLVPVNPIPPVTPVTPVPPVTPVTPPVPPVNPIGISSETIIVQDPSVTNSQQIILNNLVQLPETAIEIKEIIANIIDLAARPIPDGVLVEGLVDRTVVFVNSNNVVRSISDQIPFSVLVSFSGIVEEQAIHATVNIEDITFRLTNDGSAANQLIVLEAIVQYTPSPEQFTVITDVSGPGIVQTKLPVIANSQIAGDGAVTGELNVVTDVSGTGIGNVTKQAIPLVVVGSDNPNRVLVEVVTAVQLV